MNLLGLALVWLGLFASPARMRREAALEGKKRVSKNHDGMCCGKAQGGKKNEGTFSLQTGAPPGFRDGAAARVGALGFA